MMKKEMIAMLLAGGQGSRLYALTQNSLSFQFKFVPIKAINTPIDLTVNEIDKINIPI